ncbi:MAG: hypothetical protein C5S44_02190 [Candidatus Methanocomedens sp.]|nr:MAG: hypothetical protein C5S44_02190 [ANME-2 cluster archaeon]
MPSSPHIMQKAVLEGGEAIIFLPGLQHANIAGAILSRMVSITSLIRKRELESGNDQAFYF